MGVFDMVMVECPRCEMETIEFQSKAFNPYMKRYSGDDVPTVIAADINGSTASCSTCGNSYEAIAPLPPRVPIGLRKVRE